MKLFELYEEQFDLEKFKSDCAPFLKELQGATSYPYHGTHSGPDDYEVRNFKERTGPRDTAPDIHKELNALFKEKLGHEIRNWLFISGSPSVVRSYGKKNAIFPIGGDYNYVWSPFIDDMSTHHTTHMDRVNASNKELAFDDRREIAKDNFLNDIATITFKVDVELKEALDSIHEIHLRCKRFYIFNCDGPTFENVIDPFIRKNIFHRYETD